MSGLDDPRAISPASLSSVGVRLSHPLVGPARLARRPRRRPCWRICPSSLLRSHSAPRSWYNSTACVNAARAVEESPFAAATTAASSRLRAASSSWRTDWWDSAAASKGAGVPSASPTHPPAAVEAHPAPLLAAPPYPHSLGQPPPAAPR